MLNRLFLPASRDDCWLWVRSNNLQYSSKKGYAKLYSDQVSNLDVQLNWTSFVWIKWIPLNINAFVWKLLLDRIPTLVTLQKKKKTGF